MLAPLVQQAHSRENGGDALAHRDGDRGWRDLRGGGRGGVLPVDVVPRDRDEAVPDR
jgi:hypothetical protein